MNGTSFKLHTGHLPRIVYQSNDVKTTSFVSQIKEPTGHELDMVADIDSSYSSVISNKIKQNSGVEYLVSMFAPQQNWLISNAPTKNWRTICCSSDGTYQTACASNVNYSNVNDNKPGGIWYSETNGLNWTQSEPKESLSQQNWQSICCDSTGQYQSACVYNGGIYNSSDFGKTWTESNATQQNWSSICCSSDGTYQTACTNFSGIWYSEDSGKNWNPSYALSKNWQSICCSADGTYQSACVNSGYIWYSKDSGKNWTQSALSSLSLWVSICCSDSGQYQSACSLEDDIFNGIYYSNDYGNNWTPSTPLNESWLAICCSADGKYQTACASNISNIPGSIWYSKDYGHSWDQTDLYQLAIWSSICCSASLKYQSITDCGGGIYYYVNPSVNV
jgi:photosystem II stability/assembly factor-like uncharacterized protein